jgi:hypothetical protein
VTILSPSLVVRPTATGYVGQSGKPLRSAMDIIREVHPHSTLAMPRSGAIRKAFAQWIAAGQPQQPPQGPDESLAGQRRRAIHALLTADSWQRCEILAAPAHLRDYRDPIALSIDAIIRVTATGKLGVLILQTTPMEALNPENVRAELGAAVVFASMAIGEEIAQAVSVFALPGLCKPVSHLVDPCCLAWHHARDIEAWNARRLSAQPVDALAGTST